MLVLTQRHAHSLGPNGLAQRGFLLLERSRRSILVLLSTPASMTLTRFVRNFSTFLRLASSLSRYAVSRRFLVVVLGRVQREDCNVLLIVDNVVQYEQHHVLEVLLARLAQIALLLTLSSAIVIIPSRGCLPDTPRIARPHSSL